MGTYMPFRYIWIPLFTKQRRKATSKQVEVRVRLYLLKEPYLGWPPWSCATEIRSYLFKTKYSYFLKPLSEQNRLRGEERWREAVKVRLFDLTCFVIVPGWSHTGQNYNEYLTIAQLLCTSLSFIVMLYFFFNCINAVSPSQLVAAKGTRFGQASSIKIFEGILFRSYNLCGSCSKSICKNLAFWLVGLCKSSLVIGSRVIFLSKVKFCPLGNKRRRSFSGNAFLLGYSQVLKSPL